MWVKPLSRDCWDRSSWLVMCNHFGRVAVSRVSCMNTQLIQMVEQHPDFALVEYCEYWGETYKRWVSTSTMCRALKNNNWHEKKDVKQSMCNGASAKVEMWILAASTKDSPENLVFLDETGVELGLTRTYARCPQGSRVYALKPFYRGALVTVIGAISLKK